MSTKKALILRTTDKNGRSYGGFQWPESGHVVCPDWKPTKECGNGFHGLLWGEGNQSHLSDDADAIWWVVECDEDKIIDIQNKVKFPECDIVYRGNMADAMAKTLAVKWKIEQDVRKIKAAAKTDSATNASSGHSATKRMTVRASSWLTSEKMESSRTLFTPSRFSRTVRRSGRRSNDICFRE